MKSALKLCSTDQVSENGAKFPVFFAYRQEERDGEFHDIITPTTDKDGNPAMRAKSIRVRFSLDARKKLDAILMKGGYFPMIISIDDEKDYFLTVDKDKNKKVRYDKNGKKHLIIVIKDFELIKYCELTNYSLDDVDSFDEAQ